MLRSIVEAIIAIVALIAILVAFDQRRAALARAERAEEMLQQANASHLARLGERDRDLCRCGFSLQACGARTNDLEAGQIASLAVRTCPKR
jgi:hypothetical protein